MFWAGAMLAAASSASMASVAAPADWNRAIVEVADVDSLSLSPDGRALLFRTSRASIEQNRVLLEWHLLDTGSGETRTIGSGGDAIFDDPGLLRAEAPLWLADGSGAALRQRSDGATGIWLYRRASNGLAPAIVGAADVENLRLAPDGVSLLYEVGPSRADIRAAEEAERDQGIRVTQKVDLAQNLFRGGSVEGRMASQRLSGYWYMRSGLLVSAPRQTRRWDSATGKDSAEGLPRDPAPFTPPSLTAVASLASPGKGIADAQWDGFSGKLGWQPAHGRSIRCAAELCRTRRVSSLAWIVEGREILATFTDRHHRQTLARWNVRQNQLRILAASDGLLSGSRKGSLACQVNRRAAYCVRAGAANPPELVRVDLGDGRVSTMFDPNATLRQRYRPQVEPVALTLADGRSIAGVLLGPTGEPGQPAPLFVNYYRCEGFLRGGEGDEWPIAALIDAGFLVACLNSAPFKGKQDALATYEDGVSVVRTLIDRLAAAGRIDRKRVAMGGFSFGSEVAMRTATNSDLLAALSIASGQTEPADYWYGAILGDAHDKVTRDVWGLGRPEETPERWREVSPALNVAAIRVPVLFQLPEQEARRMPELFVRLRASGTPVDFYAFPDEAHIKVEPRHRSAVFDRNFDWFAYWLLDRRDPDPAKQDRYQAWDEMRVRRSTRAEAAPGG
ncbi:Atxe2 family lasso peptide isopeptidase [Sphingomonas sabuli]|uniref:Atxe2 family lasso peptide isopeptidase n=1 Tax=Sphingomonas sabuli TaxID=2764186 RepID=A0A7G9L3Z8_9SPHN|nr:Atxe2 family lasso peptide isopeptidase [Sphingomonas sabuli]QNM83347.1 Atxe2 family lasso peptide isopeptidase [Sphingomonas sabuli]